MAMSMDGGDGGGADLVGNIGGAQDSGPDAPSALAAVNKGVSAASGKDDAEAQKETERKLIAALCKEYETARDFDKSARITYTQDRKYAAGMSDPAWASDANLIGSFIDIMTSFLYAQNPDLNCRPAEQVGEQPNQQNTDFADTLELIISRLWLRGFLKRGMKRQVRAALTVGVGWAKGLMFSQKRPQPQVEKELHDAEDTQARLLAAITAARENNQDTADQDVRQEEISNLIGTLKSKLELQKEYGFNYDYCRSDDMQVSLDVANTEDYLSADWISEDLYIPKSSMRVRFGRLTEEDEQAAQVYYQRNLETTADGKALSAAVGAEAAEGQFSRTAPSMIGGTSKPSEFVKCIEFWDRRDGYIKTWVDGCKRWAVEPFQPPQATLRFYPYFRLSFFEVDGRRHPQSLSWRLRKLQDEYSACRSNQRLTRERCIPGLIFNAGMMSPEDAKKLEASVIAEMVAIKPTDISTPIQSIVMVKPLPTIDVRLWDTTAILSDMERISGVQEAMQAAMMSQQPKTATEAQIQQSGFASRTGADRDAIEDMMNDLAIYTAEAAIQELPPPAAQRICGNQAFWPFGMDVQDLLTMVSVDIKTGTTGKPNLALDKANWATILPLLQKLMVQIRQVQSQDPPLAKALENLLRESLHRMDDRLEISEFIPTEPPPPQPPPAPPPPSVSIALKGDLPPLDASVIGAKAAGLPPEAAIHADGGASPAAAQAAGGAPGQHPHPIDGEIQPHPMMPQPLPEPKESPIAGAKHGA